MRAGTERSLLQLLSQAPKRAVDAPFFHDDDSGAYLGYLREDLVKSACKLYAFVLMANHATCWR